MSDKVMSLYINGVPRSEMYRGSVYMAVCTLYWVWSSVLSSCAVSQYRADGRLATANLIAYLLLAYSTEQSSSWEATRFSVTQEIPRILLNPKVHYRIYKNRHPVQWCILRKTDNYFLISLKRCGELMFIGNNCFDCKSRRVLFCVYTCSYVYIYIKCK